MRRIIQKVTYIKSPLVKYRKIFLFIFIIAMIAGIGFLIKDTLGVFGQLPDITKITKQLLTENIPTKIITPEPLRTTRDEPDSYLTLSGVLNFTNEARKKEGLPMLLLNTQLNKTAQLKLEDMFKRQYFEHESPTGENVDYWANEAGYKFIILGENLALGDFKDDSALVEGWMNSPGHRANILNRQYTQIGIAVGKGKFEGKVTWLAVQHFAKPLSACPMPDENLKNQIMTYQKQLDDLEAQIALLKENLRRGKKQLTRDEYNKKVDEHNATLLEYNSILEAANKLAEKYNQQIKQFNQCVNE